MPIINTCVALTAVSLVSLVGVFTLSLQPERLSRFLLYMVSFAVGALFGDAFLHLLPETIAKVGFNLTTSFLILLGIVLFFMLEKFLRWQHCHVPTTHEHTHPVAMLNLIGDGVHNMLDGMIIASSFMVNPTIGVATTLAVIFHEIPQEIGDFGILVHSGFSVQKALWFNFLSALAAFIGALLVFIVGPGIQDLSVYVLPVTAGGFLYIAGSDLIPELHKHDVKLSASFGQLASICGGIAVMALLTFVD